MTPIIAAPIRAPSGLPTPPVAVKGVYRDFRLRGDRAFQVFVLHNDIGALRRPIVNAYLRAGLILDHFGCLPGPLVYLVEPRMHDLGNDHDTHILPFYPLLILRVQRVCSRASQRLLQSLSKI